MKISCLLQSDPNSNPNTIVRHTVPKSIQVEEPQMTLAYRSVGFDMLVEDDPSKELCKTCSSAFNTIKRTARTKSKASETPAKPKASLPSCVAEKLRATVKSTRMPVKGLEDRLKELQLKIEQQGIGISEGLEKDILEIMGGQSLEATPHMKQ